uniref:Uncharacterized protein n=1 Tax=Romanomermis culicivorax TaxID=13658 RepID=A0A915J3D1_ROMCU
MALKTTKDFGRFSGSVVASSVTSWNRLGRRVDFGGEDVVIPFIVDEAIVEDQTRNPSQIRSFGIKYGDLNFSLEDQMIGSGTDRRQLETFSLKIHFRSEKIIRNLWKTTNGNLQPNRTERKFPFRSVTLCRLHPVPFRSRSVLN